MCYVCCHFIQSIKSLIDSIKFLTMKYEMIAENTNKEKIF